MQRSTKSDEDWRKRIDVQLRTLRQACCQHSIGSKKLTTCDQISTMTDLLSNLTKEEETKCEEHQRLVLFFTITKAGLDLLQHDLNQDYVPSFAAQTYAEIVTTQYSVAVDPLQIYHCTHQLLCLMSKFSDQQLGLENLELNASTLKKRKEETEKSMLLQASLTVSSELDKLNKVQTEIKDLIVDEQDLKSFLNIASQKIFSNKILWREFRDQLKNELQSLFQTATNSVAFAKNFGIQNQFHNADGLMFLILKELEEMADLRQKILDSLTKLAKDPTELELKRFIGCDCRFSNKEYYKKNCQFCEADNLIRKYWEKLCFSVDSTPFDARRHDKLTGPVQFSNTTHISSFEKPSQLILTMKFLGKFYESRFEMTEKLKNAFLTQMELTSSRMKELQSFRNVWRQEKNKATVILELEQATFRLQLRLPDEQVSEEMKDIKILEEEIPTKNIYCKNQLVVAKNDLRQSQGHLSYLKNLFANSSSTTDRDCAICQEKITDSFVALPCVHSFHQDCIGPLQKQARGRYFKCPLCQMRVEHSSIRFIIDNMTETLPSHTQEAIPADKAPEIGTKFVAILQLVHNIISKDTKTKIIIFSEWQEVLQLLHVALKSNVEDVKICNHKSIAKQIQSFKTKDDNVLLLPVAKGANGLNLIEATHVIFVEPLLNPGIEQQAVNRVHRIGQTKETFVHRFLLENTIEPKIVSWTKDPNHFVVSKRETRVMLTEDDVKFLIGNSSDWLSGTTSLAEEDGMITEEPVSTVIRDLPDVSETEFWKTEVFWRSFWWTRDRVRERITVEQSWVFKDCGKNIHESPHELIKGKLLPSCVVDQLLQLETKQQRENSKEISQQETNSVKNSKMEV